MRESEKTQDHLPYADANGTDKNLKIQFVDACGTGVLIKPLQELTGLEKGLDEAADVMMRSAAQYICLAATLQPGSSVYQYSITLYY